MSYVGFTRLFNVKIWFPELNRDILKEGNTFPLSSSSRAFNWGKIILTSLNTYVNQIDTRTYHGYTITENILVKTVHFKYQVKWEWHVQVYLKETINRWEKYLFPCVESPLKDIIWIYWGLLQSFVTIILSVNYITWHIQKNWILELNSNSYVKQWVSGMIIIH